jgi:hypothetical protein
MMSPMLNKTYVCLVVFVCLFRFSSTIAALSKEIMKTFSVYVNCLSVCIHVRREVYAWNSVRDNSSVNIEGCESDDDEDLDQ